MEGGAKVASPAPRRGAARRLSLRKNSKDGDKPERHMTVCIRIRPLNRRERSKGTRHAFGWGGNSVYPEDFANNTYGVAGDKQHSSGSSTFNFDNVYTPEDSTQVIYENTIRPIVNASMQGYHSSVCAYGQTSTGKTFTMQGTNQNPGVIPLAVHECFSYIQNSTDDREFLFRVSYLEIYNEALKDLLSPASANIRIFDDRVKGVVVRGLKEEVVTTPDQVFTLIAAGEAQRHTGATDANAQSSRSHTIFRLIVESKTKSSSPTSTPVRVSTLQLVDLAGSESVKLANTTGERQKEGGFINKSLLTLGTVVRKLSDSAKGDKLTHVPYRDSKLTRLLQPSLGGNAQIAIVCTMTPAEDCFDESMSTLKFASRAKQVKQRAQVNEVNDSSTIIQQYELEIITLKQQLVEAQAAALESLQQSNQFGDDEIAELAIEDQEEQEDLANAINQLENLILSSQSGAVKKLKKMPPQAVLSSANPPRDSSRSPPPSNEFFRSKVDRPRSGDELDLLDDQLGLVPVPDALADDDDDQEDDLLVSDSGPNSPTPHTQQLPVGFSHSEPYGPQAAVERTESSDGAEAMVQELDRIRQVLRRVLAKVDRGGRIKSQADLKAQEQMQQTIRTLQNQIQQQQVASTLRTADSMFLENQLREKSEALEECIEVVELFEKKQDELEEQNQRLRKEIDRLKKAIVSRDEKICKLQLDAEETY